MKHKKNRNCSGYNYFLRGHPHKQLDVGYVDNSGIFLASPALQVLYGTKSK